MSVSDNGIGIDRENARRIFAMFSRIERRVEGSGIGLAVCRRVVEAHGGRIWVEPAEGGGSAFPSRCRSATEHGRRDGRGNRAVDSPGCRSGSPRRTSRSLVTPGEAVPVIEDCFRRMAAGQVELMPRRRFTVDGGYFAVMAAADRGLGVAGLKSYLLVEGRIEFVVCLFDLADGTLVAMIAADRLGQVRTGAASGVAAKHLARRGAASLGLIGAGWQAESQLAAIRAAVPSIERVVVSSRSRERAEAFAEANGADVAESPSEAGGCDVVVTATSSKDPVLRGDWLSGRRARLRDRRERSARARARRAGDRPRDGRLLRLDRGRPARVRRPDRAHRGGTARLARGAGAAPDRVRRASRPAGGHRRRRLQVERHRAVGPRDRARGGASGRASEGSATS